MAGGLAQDGTRAKTGRGPGVNLVTIGSLWIGDELSWLERASIQSFLNLGHTYRLYAYAPVSNLPEGVVPCDAREIWDTDRIAHYSKAGSPALHADIFRVMMARQTGHVWADTDIIALRPFTNDIAWYIGHEREDRVELGNAILGMPQGSQTLELLHEFLTDPTPIPPWVSPRQRREMQERAAADPDATVQDMAWGTYGPQALTYFAQTTGEIVNAQAPAAFFPVAFQDRKVLIQPDKRDMLDALFRRQRSMCVHLYSRWMRKACARRPGGFPPQQSWIGQWCEAHGVVDYGTSTTSKGPATVSVEALPDPGESPLPEGGDEFLTGLARRRERVPGGANRSRHGRTTIVTMAKDEGPYILEWVAYHHLIGFTDILVYTNDCTDGTDELLDALAAHGLVTRVVNEPWRDKPPQSRALHWASQHPLVQASDWLLVMDFDEFVVVKTTEGSLDSLIDAVKRQNATGICLTWRFFGSSDLTQADPAPVIERMTRAAPHRFPKGLGVKTLFQPHPMVELAIHRPYVNIRHSRTPEGKALNLNWLDSNGDPIDGRAMRWRLSDYQCEYRLAQLNHYGVKSHEEYLLRRLRGDVLDNHSKYDAQYFGLFDRNEVEDDHAAALAPRLHAYMTTLLERDDIRAAADLVEKRRRAKLAGLRAAPGYAAEMSELKGYNLDTAMRTRRKSAQKSPNERF